MQLRELRAVPPLEQAEVADEALAAEGVARHVGCREGPRQERELVRLVPIERHALDLLGHGREELWGGVRRRGEAPRRIGDRLCREAAQPRACALVGDRVEQRGRGHAARGARPHEVALRLRREGRGASAHCLAEERLATGWEALELEFRTGGGGGGGGGLGRGSGLGWG